MPLKTSTNLSGVTPRLVNDQPQGRVKLAKAPPTRLAGRQMPWRWQGGWSGKEVGGA